MLWVVLTAGLGVGLLTVMGGVAEAQPKRTLLAAHRGGALRWPENSRLAFRNAIALGVDFLELDVHLSRDGELVVIHDPTLDRTTTGTGAVQDRTLAELRALRLKDKDEKLTEETIPTLNEVLALPAPSTLRFLVEIKVDGQRARYPEIEEKVLATLERHRVTPRAIVMAFEPETVRRIRQLKPEVTAGALYSKRRLERMGSTVERELAELPKLGVGFVGLDQTLVSPEVINQARQAELLLGVWTVNEAQAMERFVSLGVDILITDRPDLARDLLRR